MTNSELIEKLSQLDPELEVVIGGISDDGECYTEVDFVESGRMNWQRLTFEDWDKGTANAVCIWSKD